MNASGQKLPFEGVHPGHIACAGCGAVLAMRYLLEVLGEKTVLVIPACCWGVIAGAYPASSLKVPVLHTAFETAASAASGVRAGLDRKGRDDVTVVAWAGDGGTFDIGLQALSGAAERNEDILYVCYDNEGYMNTGVQSSSATPKGGVTTTAPAEQPKAEAKKDIVAILAAHRIPYAATASIAYPEDFKKKIRRAAAMKGTRFLHVFASCPTGWRVAPEATVKIARLAVQSGVFPLYEVEDGERYTLSEVGARPVPVREYVRAQSRFAPMGDAEVEAAQAEADRALRRLKALASLS